MAHGTAHALMICWPWGACNDTSASDEPLGNSAIKSIVSELSYTELPGALKAASTKINAP